MQQYFSSNALFRVDEYPNGTYSICKVGTNQSLYVKNDAQAFELFALLCQLITDSILTVEWVTSDQDTQVLEPPPDDDDIPF